MDSLGNNNRLSNSDQPIPLDSIDKPIPLANGSSKDSPGVSRAPLNLGGGGGQPTPTPKPAPKAAPKPAPKIVVPTSGTAKATGPTTSSGQRITGAKTFFTKLHPGALEFLDELITRWLEKNPQVVIKRTNVVTGDIQAKKTEPNIIITVWY
jgi:hypothetical protein